MKTHMIRCNFSSPILYTALHKCVLSTFLAVFATTSHDYIYIYIYLVELKLFIKELLRIEKKISLNKFFFNFLYEC